MTRELQKAVLANLEKHEGRTPYIYPDSKGNPTVGVGHLLATPQAALMLPFVEAGTTLAAPPTRILTAWKFVKEHRTAYREIRLLDSDIDALTLTDLRTFEPVMQRTFHATLPLPVATALWDMLFNLGSFEKFPQLVSAVHTADWSRAAEECVRRDVGDTRNKDTQALFLGGAAPRNEQLA